MSTINGIIREYCPECVQLMYQTVKIELATFERCARGLEAEAEVLVKNNLPESVHNLFFSILRTIPESVLCGSVFLGVPLIAGVLWTAKVISICMPFIEKVLSGNIDQASMSQAFDQTVANLKEAYFNLRPAIALCALVAVVFFSLLGVCVSLSYFMKASFFAVIALLAVTSVNQDPIPAPSLAPVVQAEAASAANGSGSATGERLEGKDDKKV